ncbi:hypothetical protein FJZ53_00300 [Candidatus Woesearchaeota archaeon]|nr:hypothetical protein [Candidatus Woesearchaeota archaeon]
MKNTLVSLGLAGILMFSPVTSTFSQAQPTQAVSLEQKVSKTFPYKPVKDIENFRQYSDDILEIVAGKMNIKLNENIPKPTIVTEDEITLDEFNRRVSNYMIEHGFEPVYLNGMCPMYFEKENQILLLNSSTLHSLAHEIVHYFQVQYRHEDAANDPYDALEKEAIYVQRWFEKEHMKQTENTR